MKNSENLKNAVETQKKLDLLANLLSSEDDNTKVPFKKSFNELVEFLENEFIGSSLKMGVYIFIIMCKPSM